MAPRIFAEKLIATLKRGAEVEPNAGRKVGGKGTVKLGSDCTGLGTDFVALKLALGSSYSVKTAFISEPRR